MVNADALRDMKQQLKDGRVHFRFEGKKEGVVVFWAELNGTRAEDGSWVSEVRLGNGKVNKNEVTAADAERHFLSLWVSLHQWLAKGSEIPS